MTRNVVKPDPGVESDSARDKATSVITADENHFKVSAQKLSANVVDAVFSEMLVSSQSSSTPWETSGTQSVDHSRTNEPRSRPTSRLETSANAPAFENVQFGLVPMQRPNSLLDNTPA